MKAQRKLIPAVAMLLVALVVMSTASYAWFTMSRNVRVNGLNFTAIAPTNLLISNEVGGEFKNEVDLSTLFGEARLFPASSLTGKDGSFFAPEYIGVDSGGVAGSAAEFRLVDTPVGLNTSGYFAEFDLYMKTNGAEDVAVTFDPTIFTGTEGEDIKNAIRVAVIKAVRVDNDETTLTDTQKTVFKSANDSYPLDVEGPIATNEGENHWKGASDENFISDEETAIFTVPANQVVVKVTLRVWIEGQSNNCKGNSATDISFNFGFKDVTFGG